MNKKLLLIIIASLLGIVILLMLGNSNSTITGEDTEFTINDTASVTKFFLSDKSDNSLIIERTNEGWVINNEYFARPDLVSLVLKTMKGMAIKYPVSKAAHNNIIKLMASNSVKVEIYQTIHRINLFDKIKLFPYEAKTKVYYVGMPTQDNIGTFMYQEGADRAFVVYLPGFRGFIASRFSPRLEDWRDQTIIKKRLADIANVTVEFGETPSSSFKVQNINNRTLELEKLSTGKKIDNFDTLKVLEFLTTFRALSFEAVLTKTRPLIEDSLKYVTPLHTITLTDVQGNKSLIKTYRRPQHDEYDTEKDNNKYDLDRLYAYINDDKDFVLIQYFTFDKVFQPLEYYLKKK